MDRLAGKIAVITGAGSGIGRGCALALGAEGASVIVTDVDDASGHETCALVERAGGRARFEHLDVGEEEAWRSFAKLLSKSPGVLHVLVNNAGICISQAVTAMSYSAWRRQCAVNLDSMFLSAKYLLPLMSEAGGASIINISSVAGLQGIGGMTGYCATKGGVRLFSKALALECAQARNDVRVNSVHPGAIDTSILVKLAYGGAMPQDESQAVVAEVRAQAVHAGLAATPLGVCGQPSDVAAGVVYLASDEARFVTGSELVIDGGAFAS